MNIAVYCGSIFGCEDSHTAAARHLGELIGCGGHTLVYGGSFTGLMGTVADAVLEKGSQVIGVLPDVPLIHERKHKGISEYIYTKTMSERKEKMIELSDAYIALPGGYGTLDEISDILCLLRLGVIRKPVALVNTDGYYTELKNFFDRIEKAGYAEKNEIKNVLISDNVDEIMDFIVNGKRENTVRDI